MRAAAWRGGSLAWTERPEPVPAPGEVLLRVTRACSIEASLRLRGEDGLAGGIAFCGIVEAAVGGSAGGEGIAVSPGTPCLVDPVIPCGECSQCRSGLAGVCPTRMVLGLRGRDGGFAERAAVPIGNLLPLAAADTLLGIAPLAVPIASIVQIGRRLDLDAASTVTVLGPPPLSLLAAAVLREWSPRVRIVGDDPLVAELAAKWSLRHRPLAEAGRRLDQDAVIVASGEPGLLEIAVEMLRPRGSLGLLAAPREGVPAAVAAAMVDRQQAAIGGGLVPPREGLEVLRRGTLDLASLLAVPTPMPRERSAPFELAASPGRFGVVEFGGIPPRLRSLP